MAAAVTGPTVSMRAAHRQPRLRAPGARLLRRLPHGAVVDAADWRRRHAILQGGLLLHLPALTVFGVWTGHSPTTIAGTVVPVMVCAALATLATRRRVAALLTTAGITYCSAALVGLSHGMAEAHFHHLVVIGFIALYQDWLPFLWCIAFTVLSHGVGSAVRSDLMFSGTDAIRDPWTWSLIHGAAVLAACAGVALFWRTTENDRRGSVDLTKKLGDDELARRSFVSDLLLNLARRNQSLLYRQLEIIDRMEQQEHDPDALAELFHVDHLATRMRRNAESLLVLSGEEPPRVWNRPVPIGDVIRAAIAETEELDRVAHTVDKELAVLGSRVADLTHLLAELIENATRFSPPQTRVTIRCTPVVRSPGACLLTVEDWGVGMGREDLAAANDLLAHWGDAHADGDGDASQRLGLHVVARLAHRLRVRVSLSTMPGAGITAVLVLPPETFAKAPRHVSASHPAPVPLSRQGPGFDVPTPRTEHRPAPPSTSAGSWTGWWDGATRASLAPAPDAPGGPARTPVAPRRPEPPAPPPVTGRPPHRAPSRDAARAMDALSRHQANRQPPSAGRSPTREPK